MVLKTDLYLILSLSLSIEHLKSWVIFITPFLISKISASWEVFCFNHLVSLSALTYLSSKIANFLRLVYDNRGLIRKFKFRIFWFQKPRQNHRVYVQRILCYFQNLNQHYDCCLVYCQAFENRRITIHRAISEIGIILFFIFWLPQTVYPVYSSFSTSHSLTLSYMSFFICHRHRPNNSGCRALHPRLLTCWPD